jgi:nicotinamide mononucleotide (NMN) deamidase PncC
LAMAMQVNPNMTADIAVAVNGGEPMMK